MGPGGPGGIPGALSNQPPESGPEAAAAQSQGSNGDDAASPLNESKRSTRNFELDRTLSRTVQPTGLIERLSVAVLVDDRRVIAEDGTVTTEPMSSTELEELTRLVREAVGFDAERGDSVSVSNVSFFAEEVPPPLDEPGMLDSPMVKDVIRQGLWAVLIIALALGIIRPIIRSLSVGLTGAGSLPQSMPAYTPAASGPGAAAMQAPAAQPAAPLSFEDKVTVARQIAERNPERVAQIVRGWVQSDD
jgi:flagellar M-ring protein FliF